VAGQGTPATALLKKQKINFTIHEYAHDPRAAAYGTEAAAALGIPPERCFKTLVVEVDGVLSVAVVPVSGSLDLKACAAALGGKRASMADPGIAERATGYVVGGISPLGQRTRLRVAIDVSVRNWSTVFVSGGRRGLQVEVAPDDLMKLTSATVAEIATGH
jgi:Cys-tRNA(Pro)/Cys-tRNA(Cys) deacylase